MPEVDRDLVIGITPFGHCDARLAHALVSSGALGVLDLGNHPEAARAALGELCSRTDQPFGVRVTKASSIAPQVLPAQVDTVIVDDPSSVGDWRPRRVLVEVTSVDEARAAAARGAAGLIAKGSEAGGRIGRTSTFVLLQQLAGQVPLPIWAMGGIGLHTASACVVAGAKGVVIDAQLALVAESTLPREVKSAVASMDGSETIVLGGHRVFTRPDLPAAHIDPSTPSTEIAARLGATSLEDLLPAGQDAAFASGLAERFGTAGRVIGAMRRSIAHHISLAAKLRPLAPGAPFAARHGIRYPIAQGPMTRVSDRAAFAAAVADAGGLPFLALALMSADDTRSLLEETANLLDGRPWGVGILGFVPQAIRASQLEVIHDLRPPVVLIAGGRPSQARPLEEAGIVTYLHVPSPGLLDRFIKEGATHFVFEGRECGGHVGPRSSFSLWESQIERLLASKVAGRSSVLFAGGIHDATSAAMVSCLAAPLAEAGTSIGVLMGTAYLFTAEAVSTGAILPQFQKTALACRETDLLETSPGHVTRCARTPYVTQFTEEKLRLTRQGAAPEEMWAALESLNLGRLRVASKGLRRDGDELVNISPQEQRNEGLFMIGDVATLRRSVVTASELHEDVSVHSSELIGSITVPHVEPTGAATAAQPATRVAIIGMACVLPGAANLEDLWGNIVSGADSITEVPGERWDVDRYYDPEATTVGAGRKTPSKWGGFLPRVHFDPLRYGIPPRSLGSIEPAQLLSLEVAARALDDAGYAGREIDRERVSVFFGAEAGTDLAGAYGFRALLPEYLGAVPEELDRTLPNVTEDSFPGVLTNVIAGRIANRLDFGGSNYTVDAACASSLAAVDISCKELASGHSDMVLCGGADLHNSINDFLLFAGVHALSPTGRCRSFDASADGITLGEGIACVVLKRLDDAVRDGDRIYAVIDGVGSSSDGRSLSLTAPRKEGQQLAVERAYERAGVSPAEVGLLEAHGTGTVVGDRTELATLTELFAASGARVGSCVLGSIKSQVGHTKCAAGLAGLIKAALSVYYGVRPPTLHIDEPNGYYNPDRSPFTFLKRSQPWPEEARHAGVSAFGFGGTNFHAVLSSYDPATPPEHGLVTWPSELFLFRAEALPGAFESMDRLEGYVASLHPAGVPLHLRDLAFTTCAAGSGPVQVALVASSVDDLRDKLRAARALRDAPTPGADAASATDARDGSATGARAAATGIFFTQQPGDDGAAPGKIAFLFPGQGSQRPDMLADLFIAFPRLRRFLRMGERWMPMLFPPAAFSPSQAAAHRDRLTDTPVAQPSLGIAGLAVASLLSDLGVEADLAAGHSYGELVALCVAGAIREDELLELSEERGLAILEAAGDDPGGMAAVAGPRQAVEAVLEGLPDVVVANDNAPRQVVISGPTASLERSVELLSDAGFSAHRLPVACAFHSPVVASAKDRLRKRLGSMEIAAPSLPVWSNATAQPYPDDPDTVRDLLAVQVATGVNFTAQILDMYAAGARIFVEAGPGHVLTHLVHKTLGGKPHSALSSDSPREHGLRHLLTMLAQLATKGVQIDTGPLFEGRAKILDLTAPAKPAPAWLVDGYRTITVDGSPVPNGLLPAPRPVSGVAAEQLLRSTRARAAMSGTTEQGRQPHGAPDDPDAAVVEFLRSMREIVATQRDVMLTYLGSVPEARIAGEPAPLTRSGARSSVTNSSTTEASATAGPGEAASPTAATPATPQYPGTETQPAAEAPGRAGAVRDDGAATGRPADLDVLGVLVEIVSDRTGYPMDMLDPDLDLEADLSIDSIKRMEILGELADRVPMPGSSDGAVADEMIEDLVQIKTLRGVAQWLEAAGQGGQAGQGGGQGGQGGGQGGPHLAAEPTERRRSPDGPASEPGLPGLPGLPGGIERYVPRLLPVSNTAPALDTTVLSGRQFAIVDDEHGVATELSAILDKHGASVEVITAGAAFSGAGSLFGSLDPGEIDGLVYLGALGQSGSGDDQAPHAEELFRLARALLSGHRRLRWLLAVTSLDAGTSGRSGWTTPIPRGAGIRGLLRSISKERPAIITRAIDIDAGQGAATTAEAIITELLYDDGLADVVRKGGMRAVTRYERADTAPLAARGPEGTASQHSGLGPDSVVVLTGGARGITAAAAIELARRFACRLELLGRSPLPARDEDPSTVDAGDLASIRRALIASGMRSHAEIEARAAEILASREVRRTLAQIAAAGGVARYHPVDVRDRAALAGVIGEIYARQGRIDAVIHGAGVVEDKLIEEKSPESFARVFSTKVGGASNLLHELRPGVGLVVFFTSVAGAFGNRGQADYAAANDALATYARALAPQVSGRVLAIDWGPWSGAGMVSEELEREYARRSIGLIPVADGVRLLIDELQSATADEVEVLVMRAAPEAFDPA